MGRSIDRAERISFLAGAALPFEEAAGNLPCRVGLLTVLDREGEERQVRRFVLHGHGDQDYGLAELDQAGPLREAGHAAHLEGKGTTRKGTFDSVCHLFVSKCGPDPIHGAMRSKGADGPR